MPKTLSQLISPASAVIAPYMNMHGIPYQYQLALLVTGKIYALKAAGGTDYTTNVLQLAKDTESSELGETDDELMATRVSVWLQAMTGGASPTITSSGTPPATSSAALALAASKKLMNYPAETLLEFEVYLDALLVKALYTP